MPSVIGLLTPIALVLGQNEELRAKNEALITEMAGLKGILQEASSDIELARRQQLAQYAFLLHWRLWTSVSPDRRLATDRTSLPRLSACSTN